MALEGCAACLKYLMIIWNFIILILGIAVLGVGIWMVVDKDSGKYIDNVLPDSDTPFVINYSRVTEGNMFETLAYVLIAFGSIVTIIAFLGYLGAMRESQCLLGTCFVLLFLIFSALVAAGIYMYVKRDEIEVDEDKLREEVSNMLTQAVKNYHTDDPSKEFMNAIQKRYECCGADHGAIDYVVGAALPGGCNLLTSVKPCTPLYFDDLKSKIGVKQFFSGKFTVALGVALGAAGSLILAMILTLILCCSIRRSGSY